MLEILQRRMENDMVDYEELAMTKDAIEYLALSQNINASSSQIIYRKYNFGSALNSRLQTAVSFTRVEKAANGTFWLQLPKNVCKG